MVFLGTGAAQGVPPVYSRTLERSIGPASPQDQLNPLNDRNIRTRSSIRLGQRHQVDAGPDIFWQLARERMSWYDLEHLIITHTHSDHFYFDGILQKQNAGDNNGRRLTIHLSRASFKWFIDTWSFMRTLRAPTDTDRKAVIQQLERWYSFNILEFYTWARIGDLQVCPIPGNHTGRVPADIAMNLIVMLPCGYRFLYGLDTGYYADEVFDFLAGQELDMVVLDCTFGGRTDRPDFPDGHLDCSSLIRVLERLESRGTITATTPVYASHINPDQGLDHSGLDRRFACEPYHVVTAWDGMRVELR